MRRSAYLVDLATRINDSMRNTRALCARLQTERDGHEELFRACDAERTARGDLLYEYFGATTAFFESEEKRCLGCGHPVAEDAVHYGVDGPFCDIGCREDWLGRQ